MMKTPQEFEEENRVQLPKERRYFKCAPAVWCRFTISCFTIVRTPACFAGQATNLRSEKTQRACAQGCAAALRVAHAPLQVHDCRGPRGALPIQKGGKRALTHATRRARPAHRCPLQLTAHRAVAAQGIAPEVMEKEREMRLKLHQLLTGPPPLPRRLRGRSPPVAQGRASGASRAGAVSCFRELLSSYAPRAQVCCNTTRRCAGRRGSACSTRSSPTRRTTPTGPPHPLSPGPRRAPRAARAHLRREAGRPLAPTRARRRPPRARPRPRRAAFPSRRRSAARAAAALARRARASRFHAEEATRGASRSWTRDSRRRRRTAWAGRARAGWAAPRAAPPATRSSGPRSIWRRARQCWGRRLPGRATRRLWQARPDPAGLIPAPPLPTVAPTRVPTVHSLPPSLAADAPLH